MARIDGSYSKGGSNYTFYILWEVVNTKEDRISNNRSLIRVEAYGKRIGSNLGYYNNYNHNCSISINGDNETKSDTKFDYRNTNEVLLYQREIYVEHNNDGTKRININATHYSEVGLGNGYASSNIDLPIIPREASITGDLNYTIADEINLNIFNTGNFNVVLDFFVNNVWCFNRIGKFKDITVINLTEEEKDLMYSKMPDSNTGDFQINVVTIADDEKQIGNIQVKKGSIKINVDLVKPIFNNFNYQDINATTVALTGNDQTVIKKYSNVKLTINNNDKALAKKGASIIKYRIECGEIVTEVPYIDNVEVTLNNIESSNIKVQAIDSRSNKTEVIKKIKVINYTEPVITKQEMFRDGGISTVCTISTEGKYNVVNFGAIENNITKVEYKKNDDEWIDCTNLFTFSEGNINTISNAKIGGFVVGTKYIVQLRITDKLGYSNIRQVEINSGESTLILNTDKKLLSIGKIPDKTLPKGSINTAGGVYSMSPYWSESLNNIKNTCSVYAVGDDKPSSNGYCFTQVITNDYMIQEFIPAGYYNTKYTRQKYGGTWTSWKCMDNMTILFQGSVSIPSFQSSNTTTITLEQNVEDFDYLVFSRGTFGSAISKRNNAGMSAGMISVGGGNDFQYSIGLYITCSGNSLKIGGNSIAVQQVNGGGWKDANYTGIPLTEVVGIRR